MFTNEESVQEQSARKPALWRAPATAHHRAARNLALGLVLLYVVFTVHHVYGAAVYDTPERLEGILPFGLLLVATLWPLHYALRGGWIALTLCAALVSVGWLGVLVGFEGAFNHVLKVAFHLAGTPEDRLAEIFAVTDMPFAVPDDVFFEATGILQFVVGVAVAWYLVRLVREHRRSPARD